MAKKRAKAVPAVHAVEYCGNCRFYKQDTGICQRGPAQAIVADGDVFSVRPIMEPAEWCGEHQMRGPRQ